MFTNKVLLITGGTGSFGNAVLDRFLKSDIFSLILYPKGAGRTPELGFAAAQGYLKQEGNRMV